VWFGQPLWFVVTPKTRQAGGALIGRLRLVSVQVVALLLLTVAALWGLARLALGAAPDGVAVLVNVAWISYHLVMLSVVLDAVMYEPPSDDNGFADERSPHATAALAHGRAMAGAR
jgi:cellulose synthase (UDP-forming)